MDTDTTYSPEGPGGPRRGLFTRRPDAPEVLPPPPQRTTALDLAIAERLDDGLLAIEEHAATLMRIATLAARRLQHRPARFLDLKE